MRKELNLTQEALEGSLGKTYESLLGISQLYFEGRSLHSALLWQIMIYRIMFSRWSSGSCVVTGRGSRILNEPV